MKADLFLVAAAACVAGVFLYAFIGGLVVRAVNVLKPFRHGAEEKAVAVACWPVVLAAAVAVGLVAGAYRLSQWRPKRKSTLPGARVVKP